MAKDHSKTALKVAGFNNEIASKSPANSNSLPIKFKDLFSDNSAASERNRILHHRKAVGPLTTLQARHTLDCMHPGTSVCKLRKAAYSRVTAQMGETTSRVHNKTTQYPGKWKFAGASKPVNLRTLKVGSKQWYKERERLRKEAELKLESVKTHHPIRYSLWMEGLEDWVLLIPEPSGIAIGCLRVDDALKCLQNVEEGRNA